jgi:tetratricopeptide (TPR) repeat protein
MAVLAAPGLAELRALIDSTPELLSDGVGDALRVMAGQVRANGESDLADHADAVAALLRRCRLVGTSEAFAEVTRQPTGVEQAWAAAVTARDAGDTTGEEAEWRRLLVLLPERDERPVPLARLDALNALGALLLARYSDSGAAHCLDEAVRLWELAAEEAEPGPAADYRNNLAAGLIARYELRGDPVDLTRAISSFAAAVNDPNVSLSTRTFARNGLGGAQLTRYEASGERADLDSAISNLDASLAGEDGPRPDGVLLGNLGLGLLSRYEAAGNSNDLRRAVAVLRTAAAALSIGCPEGCSAAVNLGNALLQSYLADGATDVLDDAIATTEQAIASAPNTVDLPSYRNTLGGCLMARFDSTGELDQLDRAVAAFQQAVDDTPVHAPELAIYLDSLASGRREQFVRRGDSADIRAAITAAERAVAATGPTATERPRRLATLANCLATDPASASSAGHVERIVTCYSDAVRSSPADAPERWLYTANLASGLLDRYERDHVPADLDAAVLGYRDALTAAPAEAQGVASLHYNLAVALDLRHQAGGDDSDREATLAELQTAVQGVHGLNIALLAGRDLGNRWARAGHWEQAADAYGTAVAAMLRLVRLQPVRADSEVWLRDAGQLTADATLSTARAGLRSAAATVLDQGRALLLSFVIERERIDLSRLRDSGYAGLADRYQRAAVVLSRLELAGPGGVARVALPAAAATHVPA